MALRTPHWERSAEGLRSVAKRLGAATPLALFDLEATGTWVDFDRIVAISLAVWSPPTMERAEMSGGYMLVNPGMRIPEGASDVHGITDDRVKNEPRFASIAKDVARLLAGATLVGYGIRRYDKKLLKKEFLRAGLDIDVPSMPHIDAQVIYHEKFKRDLSACVKEYTGYEMVDAHGADADTAGTIWALAGQLQRHTDLPQTVEGLAEFCRQRRPEFLDTEGLMQWRFGRAMFASGKHVGAALEDVDRGYFQWALGKGADRYNDEQKAYFRMVLNGVEFIQPALDDGIWVAEAANAEAVL